MFARVYLGSRVSATPRSDFFPIHRERSGFEGARSKQIGGLLIELQTQIESLQTFAVRRKPAADMLSF